MIKLSQQQLIGKTYSSLTIRKFLHTDSRNHDWYECKCICGSVIEAIGVAVRNNRVRSCGCANGYSDLLGRKFGYLTLVQAIDAKRPDRYLARCICKTEFEVQGSHVKKGYIKSCGCRRDTSLGNRGLDNQLVNFSGFEDVIKSRLACAIFKALRLSKGLKIQLVNIEGVSNKDYSSIEVGDKQPTTKEENLILDFYGVSRETYEENVTHYNDIVKKRIIQIGMDSRMTMPELVDRVLLNTLLGKETIAY